MVFAKGEKDKTDRIRYTVEFSYGEHEYVMSGGDGILLSGLLDQLELSGEIRSWTVSDPSLFGIFWGDSRGVLYEDAEETIPANEGDTLWLLSFQPFDTTEWLKVVIDGIYTDSIPYMLTLGFIVLCFAAFFGFRRKVRIDD